MTVSATITTSYVLPGAFNAAAVPLDLIRAELELVPKQPWLRKI